MLSQSKNAPSSKERQRRVGRFTSTMQSAVHQPAWHASWVSVEHRDQLRAPVRECARARKWFNSVTGTCGREAPVSCIASLGGHLLPAPVGGQEFQGPSVPSIVVDAPHLLVPGADGDKQLTVDFVEKPSIGFLAARRIAACVIEGRKPRMTSREI